MPKLHILVASFFLICCNVVGLALKQSVMPRTVYRGVTDRFSAKPATLQRKMQAVAVRRGTAELLDRRRRSSSNSMEQYRIYEATAKLPSTEYIEINF